MTDTTRAQLMVELGRAASRLDAPPAIVSLIGGWDLGHNDHAVLSGLRAWNDERRGSPHRRRLMPVEEAIIVEIYNVFRYINASPELLGHISNWHGGFDDVDMLIALRKFNRAGSAFDRQ